MWRRAGRRARIFLADEGAAYKRAAFERGGGGVVQLDQGWITSFDLI